MIERMDGMNENEHDKIDLKCAECNYVVGDICRVFLSPSAKWRNYARGINCPMCTTVVRGKTSTIKRVGQPKGKKKKK